MIVFKDRSWYSFGVKGVCSNMECDKMLTPELRKAAVAWWGDKNFPLQVADLKTKDCGAKLKKDHHGFYRN